MCRNRAAPSPAGVWVRGSCSVPALRHVSERCLGAPVLQSICAWHSHAWHNHQPGSLSAVQNWVLLCLRFAAQLTSNIVVQYTQLYLVCG